MPIPGVVKGAMQGYLELRVWSNLNSVAVECPIRIYVSVHLH